MRGGVVMAAGAVLTMGVLAGCGSEDGPTGGASSSGPSTSTSSPSTSSATPSSSATPTTSATSPTSTVPPPKGTALPSTPPPRGDGTTDDLTVEGTIGYPGLTCVLMRTADGKPYALTGPAVTSDVRTRARGGQQAAADPAGGSATRTRVRVTGHVDPNALSTCHAPVLVSSRIEVLGPAG